MSEVFRVWDEDNSDEAFAFEIEALSAEDAVVECAKLDVDGNLDGLYCNENGMPMTNVPKNGVRICVRDSNGNLMRFAVGVTEFEPVYTAVRVEDAKDGERA